MACDVSAVAMFLIPPLQFLTSRTSSASFMLSLVSRWIVISIFHARLSLQAEGCENKTFLGGVYVRRTIGQGRTTGQTPRTPNGTTDGPQKGRLWALGPAWLRSSRRLTHTEKLKIFVDFFHFWPILAIFDHFWQNLTILTSCLLFFFHFWPVWPVLIILTSFVIFDYFWPCLTIFDWVINGVATVPKNYPKMLFWAFE